MKGKKGIDIRTLKRDMFKIIQNVIKVVTMEQNTKFLKKTMLLPSGEISRYHAYPDRICFNGPQFSQIDKTIPPQM